MFEFFLQRSSSKLHSSFLSFHCLDAHAWIAFKVVWTGIVSALLAKAYWIYFESHGTIGQTQTNSHEKACCHLRIAKVDRFHNWFLGFTLKLTEEGERFSSKMTCDGVTANAHCCICASNIKAFIGHLEHGTFLLVYSVHLFCCT